MVLGFMTIIRDVYTPVEGRVGSSSESHVVRLQKRRLCGKIRDNDHPPFLPHACNHTYYPGDFRVFNNNDDSNSSNYRVPGDCEYMCIICDSIFLFFFY